MTMESNLYPWSWNDLRVKKTRSNLLFWIYSVGQFQLQFTMTWITCMKLLYLSYVKCIISYVKYTTRFSYMKIHIWNYQNSHMKWISYVKFPFSYVNCITSYMTWFSYMKILIWIEITKFHMWNGFHIWNLVFHMWIV
jgi:hypothetical protein